MIRLTFIPIGFAVGWITDSYGIQVALIALAGFVLFANIWNVKRLL
jgi:hypothetical protein